MNRNRREFIVTPYNALSAFDIGERDPRPKQCPECRAPVESHNSYNDIDIINCKVCEWAIYNYWDYLPDVGMVTFMQDEIS